MDLGALAALSAIAADPAATQTAREFLAQQKLQSDRLKAEQGMREAELQLQENANRRSMEADYARMGQQQKQFETEQGRLRLNDQADAADRTARLGLQKDSLAEEIRHNKAVEDEAIARGREVRMNNAIESYINLQKAHSKGTGLSPISPDKLLESLGPMGQMLWQDPRTPEGKKNQEKLQAGIAGGLGTLYSAMGINAAPEQTTAYGNEMAAFLRGISADIKDPAEKAAFTQEFLSRVGAPDVSMRAGVQPSVEESKKVILDMSTLLVRNLSTGDTFSPEEMSAFAYVWNNTGDPTVKAQYLDSIINTVSTVMGEQKGWDQQQKLEFNGNFRGVLDNVIKNGEAGNLSPYIIGGAGSEPNTFQPFFAAGTSAPGMTAILAGGKGLKAAAGSIGHMPTLGERRQAIEEKRQRKSATPITSPMTIGLRGTAQQFGNAVDQGIQRGMSAEGYEGTMGGITRAARERQKSKLTPKRGRE